LLPNIDNPFVCAYAAFYEISSAEMPAVNLTILLKIISMERVAKMDSTESQNFAVLSAGPCQSEFQIPIFEK